MTTSTLAFGKASASGSLKLSIPRHTNATKKLYYSTAPATSPPPTNGNGNGNGTPQPKPADSATQRELFMNVLNANATKRDAKQYLSRFKSPSQKSSKLSPLEEEWNARHRRDQDRLDSVGVNLGALYAPARAIAASPKFTRDHVEESPTSASPTVHVALVYLRAPETLGDATLDGVALTLSQLVKLDMRLLLVLDCGNQLQSGSEGNATSLREMKKVIAEQGERITQAMDRYRPEGARLVPGAIETRDETSITEQSNSLASSSAIVSLPKLLLDPLKRSVIPIVPTLAHTPSGQQIHLSASSIMTALSSLLSGLSSRSNFGSQDADFLETSLDRIIVLDSAGGIPSKARGDGAHVFINLEQEFDDIQSELAAYGREKVAIEHSSGVPNVYEKHRFNLSMLQNCLAMLPSGTSALIITPQEAAISSQAQSKNESTIGTGTRRQKNTLIHNLLTNKPLVSSSLPVARFPSTSNADGEAVSIDMPRATLIKRGMPLTIIPAADRALGWQAPADGKTTLDLANDPRVDLARLVHLIEDSFRRKLDVKHYLNRIRGRIAGLIVAGEYEGGAILTWEQPPNASPNSPNRLVPYLDKFAVLSSSQGSSGVADIVFQAMVRTCFPRGVCWRSRKDNPVNKWYFERSDGTWQIPESNWTMFWTGDGIVEDKERWEDYVGVCREVRPSWADGKKVAD